MLDQPDLFSDGVTEGAPRIFPPALGASGIDPIATLDEDTALSRLLSFCGVHDARCGVLAGQLLNHFGGVGRVLGAPAPDLARLVGEDVARDLTVLHAVLMRVLEVPLRRREALSAWSAVRTYLSARMRALPREAFHVLFLDNRNQLIADERMGQGSIKHAPVYPREVVRRALELSAAAIILAHNHPTGDATPSSADVEMTRLVVAACRALDVAVHDHFIVAGDEVSSLKTLGLM